MKFFYSSFSVSRHRLDVFLSMHSLSREPCASIWCDLKAQFRQFPSLNSIKILTKFLSWPRFDFQKFFIYFILLFLRDLYVDSWRAMVCVSVDIVRLIHVKCLCDSCLRLMSTVELCLLSGESGHGLKFLYVFFFDFLNKNEFYIFLTIFIQ